MYFKDFRRSIALSGSFWKFCCYSNECSSGETDEHCHDVEQNRHWKKDPF